jgi:tripartite-type tricarboxylate transporter receptor subunit TctC
LYEILTEGIVNISRRQFLNRAMVAAAAPMVSSTAFAETYPSRPVRAIVPFAPGGQTDVVARLVAQKLSDSLGKQIFIENVSGAGGSIGVGRAAQSPPDGYTILFVDGIGFVTNPVLQGKVPYDPIADFEPVTIAATTMQVVAVHPSVPAKTVQELVDLIRASPGKFSYASAGPGSGSHLTGELFRSGLNLDLVHVPYGGGGPAIASTVAGHTPISIGSAAATIPQHQDGKLRALAVGGKTRLKALPDVPTLVEMGYKDAECDAVVGVLVPAKTPKEIVDLLHKEIQAAVATAEMQERLAKLGFQTTPSTPAELSAFFKADLARWANIIRTAGIKAN